MAPEIIQKHLLLLRLALMNIVLGGESFVQQMHQREETSCAVSD